MATVDWAKLVRQDRAKRIGIAWSEKELKAIYTYGIKPVLVRKGILTLEDMKKGKEIVNNTKDKGALIEEAKDKGVNFLEDAPTEVIEAEINAKNTEKELGEKELKEEDIKEIEAEQEYRDTPYPQLKRKVSAMGVNTFKMNKNDLINILMKNNDKK